MKKLLSVVLLMYSSLSAAGSKPAVKISPAFQVVNTDEAFSFNIVLLGEFPNYYIVEVLYEHELLTASIRDSSMGRVVTVKGVVTREMYITRTAPLPDEEYHYDAEISDPQDPVSNPNFTFEVVVRSPTKEEGTRVHLSVEDLETEFGTKKWGYVWARGKANVRANCLNCTQ